MFHSDKIVHAPVTFVDIAGIVKGASEGAGLGNKFLANIRECDAICQVVRVFTDDDVTHVDGRIDPRSDIEVIETELMLADMQTLERALPRLEKEARTHKDRRPVHEAAVAAQEVLDGGRTLFGASFDATLLRELNLLTTKPFLYVFNADEGVLTDDARVAELRELVAPADAVFLDAKIEAELQELDEESAAELLESIGQTERGLDALARAGFHTLKLQTFLTAGPKESRAWTIHRGDTAPKAAGVIHTDFEKGFIKAEIVSYDDLVEAGSMAAAKSAGKVRMEGKDYVMADGDVVSSGSTVSRCSSGASRLRADSFRRGHRAQDRSIIGISRTPGSTLNAANRRRSSSVLAVESEGLSERCSDRRRCLRDHLRRLIVGDVSRKGPSRSAFEHRVARRHQDHNGHARDAVGGGARPPHRLLHQLARREGE